MKLNLIAFLFGVILLAISIIGGGFELKELKVPKVSWFPRLISAFVGMFFVVLGIGLDPSTSDPGSALSNPQSTNPPQSSINFTISDKLGAEIGQVSEQVTVFINERMVGTLTVNQDYQQAVLQVTVPSPGGYTFTANGRAVFSDGVERSCAGQGNVDVSDGKNYAVTANIGGNTCSITLED
jgi:hypothetical protein